MIELVPFKGYTQQELQMNKKIKVLCYFMWDNKPVMLFYNGSKKMMFTGGWYGHWNQIVNKIPKNINEASEITLEFLELFPESRKCIMRPVKKKK